MLRACSGHRSYHYLRSLMHLLPATLAGLVGSADWTVPRTVPANLPQMINPRADANRPPQASGSVGFVTANLDLSR